MINVEIIKVYAGQILPCGQVTGNKEFTIGGLIHAHFSVHLHQQVSGRIDILGFTEQE